MGPDEGGGGGIIGGEVLAVNEELQPGRPNLLLRPGTLGTRWVRPISLDRHRAVIVRQHLRQKDPPLLTPTIRLSHPKTRQKLNPRENQNGRIEKVEHDGGIETSSPAYEQPEWRTQRRSGEQECC
jgi:hypothetical protein